MLPRVIPSLLLEGARLVKTTRFKDPVYLGDPRNAVKVFNEKEVDEILLLDIGATRLGRPPQYELLSEVISEAFMPLAYGGGVATVAVAEKVLRLGVEKVVLNSAALDRPELVTEAATRFGSQSVVVSIDVKRVAAGRHEVYSNGGRKRHPASPGDLACQMEDRGAGELILTSIDRDGTMSGYDTELLRAVTGRVGIPVVASGGAGKLADLKEAVMAGGASAAAAGSLFVFHGKLRAVLISYPPYKSLQELFGERVAGVAPDAGADSR